MALTWAVLVVVIFIRTEPLQNNCDQFCKTHDQQHSVCAIVGCNNLTMAKSKAYTTPKHQKMENLNKQRGKAVFTLTQRLQHAHVSHPIEVVSTSDVLENDDLKEHIEWFETDE